MNVIENGFETGLLTTRTAVVERVAAGWLESHPEVPVTTRNLAKTLQQILTEVFLTGQERCRRSLSGYAVSLMQTAAVDPDQIAAARTFRQSADLPARYATIFAHLSTVLAPLAAAVQLSRTAVADAAFARAKSSSDRLCITRLALRGYVEATVRPHALRIHQRVGYDHSAHDYLQHIVEDLDQLAAGVLGAAIRKATRSTCLSDEARVGFEKFFRAHDKNLRIEARKYGGDADEIYSQAIGKMAVAYRNNPSLEADLAYGRKVLKNVLNSCMERRSSRPEVLLEEIDGARLREPVRNDSCDEIFGTDAVVRRLLGIAESLSSSAAPEASLASELLVKYFFVDPTIRDPRRAELASHLWELSGADDGAELEKGLCELAKNLSTAARPTTIATMVMKALGHKGGLD